MGNRVAWRFRDAVLSEVYFLPVNPSADSGSHAINKNVRYQAAASTYIDSTNLLRVGNTVAQDAPDEQETFTYTGTVYTKDQFDQMLYWFEKNYPWFLRDDLLREFLIYPESYDVTRVRSSKFRWKHSYSLTGIVLREVSV